MDSIREILAQRDPNLEELMNLTMRKEREAQEKKDAKVLDILKMKDKQIEDLQHKLAQAE